MGREDLRKVKLTGSGKAVICELSLFETHFTGKTCNLI